MSLFLKATAYVLISLILGLVLSKHGKDFGLFISLTTCCVVVCSAKMFLQPILALWDQIISLGNLDSNMFQVLIKAAGIGLISQITSLICKDAEQAAIGKALEILATAAILWLALPLLTELMILVENILSIL